MKSILLGCFIFLLALASCKKEDRTTSRFPDGDYIGFFYRYKPSIPPATPVKSNVVIHFHEGKYSGNSDSSNYPILCQGNYSSSSSHLNVVNTCFYTANIDWTYIFDGQYDITYDGLDLLLIKKYANGEEDHYVLRRQP